MKKFGLGILIIVLYAPCLRAQSGQQTRPLTDAEGKAVVQAILDEVYDYGYQANFDNVGRPVGKHGTQLTAYVSPTRTGAVGRVIYKLMPYGEVFRLFTLREDGLVVLNGDSEIGFPPTQPNTLTLYLDDDEICAQKKNWTRLQFNVEFSPSSSLIQEAVVRQKKRFGFSIREVGSNGRADHPKNK